MFHYLPWLFVGVFVVAIIFVLIKKFRSPCDGDADAGGTSLDDIDNRADNRIYEALTGWYYKWIDQNSAPRDCYPEDNYRGGRRRKKGKAKGSRRSKRRN